MLNLENMWVDGPHNITPEFVADHVERQRIMEERTREVFSDYVECFGKHRHWGIEKIEFEGECVSLSLERSCRGCTDWDSCVLPMYYFYLERPERLATMLAEKKAEDEEATARAEKQKAVDNVRRLASLQAEIARITAEMGAS